MKDPNPTKQRKQPCTHSSAFKKKPEAKDDFASKYMKVPREGDQYGTQHCLAISLMFYNLYCAHGYHDKFPSNALVFYLAAIPAFINLILNSYMIYKGFNSHLELSSNISHSTQLCYGAMLFIGNFFILDKADPHKMNAWFWWAGLTGFSSAQCSGIVCEKLEKR